MEEVITILLSLAFVNAGLRLCFVKKQVAIMIILSAGLFSYISHYWIIEQSSAYTRTLWADKSMLNNIVLLVIVEAICFLSLHFARVKFFLAPQNTKKRNKLLFTVGQLPGPSLYLAIYYFQHRFYMLDTGLDFETAALGFAIVCMAALTACGLLVHYLLNHQQLLLESSLFIDLSMLVLAIVMTALGNPPDSLVQVAHPLPFMPLLSFLLIAFTLALTGYLITIIKKNKK
ncbi:hypothetical protein [Olivibacter sitiensis]|uniref:hypothetical protein n=1 Tax=Olivibacter sitiensis TaxID=376470 RepID=UPI0004171217|nr:hypothetical protein [Olivibacter sitiensis]